MLTKAERDGIRELHDTMYPEGADVIMPTGACAVRPLLDHADAADEVITKWQKQVAEASELADLRRDERAVMREALEEYTCNEAREQKCRDCWRNRGHNRPCPHVGAREALADDAGKDSVR